MNLYPEYEYKCPKCDGTGCYFEQDDQEVYLCGKCGGTGAVLTRHGELIIEFVKRHIDIGGDR